MRGRSQQDRTSKGVEIESVAIIGLNEAQLLSERFWSQVRLISAIKKLWAKVVGQSHLGFESQMVGASIRVGIRTFSIVTGLSFGSGRSRGFGLWRPGGLSLCLLRRLRMLVEGGGRRRS